MSEEHEEDLRAILKHGILTPGERAEVNGMLLDGEQGGVDEDHFQKILCDHRYALEAARKSKA